MRIVAVADLHLTLRENYGITTKDGINSRVYDKLNALKEAVEYAIKNKADLFIDGGDSFDLLNPPEILRLKFIEAISPLLQAKIPTIIVMGNHVYNANYYNLQSEEALLRALNNSTLEIISTPTTKVFNGITFSFIPWSPIEAIREFIKNNPKTIVFHHVPIKGALLNDYEIEAKEGLTKEDLNTQLFWFGGHYHKHQLQDNWCYIGSLAKQDFSERNQKKGFLDILLDLENGDLDFEIIETDKRKFIQLEFTEPQNPIEFINSLDDLEGAVIKSVLKGSKPWLYKLNKMEYIEILKSKGALRVLQPELISNDENVKKERAIDSRSSFESNIKTYCKKKDKPEFEPIMQQILLEVQNSRKVI